ncbi:hypothetical protein ENBRE01_3399 [Enteropsectra breve]|nr:hypothetical protein ENBRE01_3399 [Enteropsectra breve]
MKKTIRIETVEEKMHIIEYCKFERVLGELTGDKRFNFIKLAKNFIYEEGTLFLSKETGKLKYFCEFEHTDKRLFIEAAHRQSHIGATQIEEYVFGRARGISCSDIRD